MKRKQILSLFCAILFFISAVLLCLAAFTIDGIPWMVWADSLALTGIMQVLSCLISLGLLICAAAFLLFAVGGRRAAIWLCRVGINVTGLGFAALFIVYTAVFFLQSITSLARRFTMPVSVSIGHFFTALCCIAALIFCLILRSCLLRLCDAANSYLSGGLHAHIDIALPTVSAVIIIICALFAPIRASVFFPTVLSAALPLSALAAFLILLAALYTIKKTLSPQASEGHRMYIRDYNKE